MHKDYLSKLLQLEEYIIDKIDFEESRITVHCHSYKRGMWHADEYTEALSSVRIKTARHMILESKVVILRIRQRKFFLRNAERDYGRDYPALNETNMIHLCLGKTA